MKKLILFSVISMFAASAAHAVGYTTNRMDGNALYMPEANQFYSVSDLASHTGMSGEYSIQAWDFTQEVGYGITDRWMLIVSTNVRDERSFDKWSWDNLAIETTFRASDIGMFKTDLILGYAVSPIWANHRPFLEEKNGVDAYGLPDGTGTGYTWALGVRAGWTIPYVTIIGKALFEYWNTESFNWYEEPGKQGLHALIFGLEGQFAVNHSLNWTVGLEYMGFLDKELYGTPGWRVENAGTVSGTLGLNYSIGYDKYIGGYVNWSMNHQGGPDNDEWEFDNGIGFGGKFGIAF